MPSWIILAFSVLFLAPFAHSAVESYSFNVLWNQVRRFNKVAPSEYSNADAEEAAWNAVRFYGNEGKKVLRESKWISQYPTNLPKAYRYWRFAPMLNSDLTLRTIENADSTLPNLDVVMFQPLKPGAVPQPFAILRPTIQIRSAIRFEIVHDFTTAQHSDMIRGMNDHFRRTANLGPEPVEPKTFYKKALDVFTVAKDPSTEEKELTPRDTASSSAWQAPPSELFTDEKLKNFLEGS